MSVLTHPRPRARAGSAPEQTRITPRGDVQVRLPAHVQAKFEGEQGASPPVPPSLSGDTRGLVPNGITVTVNPSESDDFLKQVAHLCLPWQLEKARRMMLRARLRELDSERHLARARRCFQMEMDGHELAGEAGEAELELARKASVGAERMLARAAGMARRLDERVESCETEKALVWHCHACTRRHATPKKCGARSVCEACSAYRPGLRKRIKSGVGDALRAAKAKWNRQGRQRGREPRLALLTLSVAHSGDVAADRATIEKGWKRLRAWLASVDAAHSGYVKTWELTLGTDAKGHAHAHIAIILPWLPLGRLTEEWTRATDGKGVQADLARPSRHKSARPRGGVDGSVAYVTKYVTKGHVQRTWGTDVSAAWVRASSGKRAYTTSRALLLVEKRAHLCPDCGGDCAMVGARLMGELGALGASVDARAGPRDPPS